MNFSKMSNSLSLKYVLTVNNSGIFLNILLNKGEQSYLQHKTESCNSRRIKKYLCKIKSRNENRINNWNKYNERVL